MADCGAAGSVLDQTARAMAAAVSIGAGGTGNHNANSTMSQGTKMMASLLGHASRVSTTTDHGIVNMNIPLQSPHHIVLPSSGTTFMSSDPWQRQQQQQQPQAITNRKQQQQQQQWQRQQQQQQPMLEPGSLSSPSAAARIYSSSLHQQQFLLHPHQQQQQHPQPYQQQPLAAQHPPWITMQHQPYAGPSPPHPMMLVQAQQQQQQQQYHQVMIMMQQQQQQQEQQRIQQHQQQQQLLFRQHMQQQQQMQHESVMHNQKAIDATKVAVEKLTKEKEEGSQNNNITVSQFSMDEETDTTTNSRSDVSNHDRAYQHQDQQQQQQQFQDADEEQQQQQQQQQLDGHEGVEEGIVHPLTMEQLREAWQLAQDETFFGIDPDAEDCGGATMEEYAAAAWSQIGDIGWEEEEDDVATNKATNLAAATSTVTTTNPEYDGDIDAWLDQYKHTTTSTTIGIPPYEFQYHIDTMNDNIYDGTEEKNWQQQQQETDWMQAGMYHFHVGDLHKAIHAFEMELQQQPQQHKDDDTNDDQEVHHHDIAVQTKAEAWRMLGLCHAEHDMDQLAIACLERAKGLNPFSAETALALGVSYVNELNHAAALLNLKSWIVNHPQLSNMMMMTPAGATTTALSMASAAGSTAMTNAEENEEDLYGPHDDSNDTTSTAYSGTMRMESTEAAFHDVQRLLLRALRAVEMEHHSNHPNDDNQHVINATKASVLEAMGVVYNVSRDYRAAVRSFEQALALRLEGSTDSSGGGGDHYALWNKLGATLANSNRSAEALSAYHEAIRRKPKYARAWLNMAISHAALHQYDEAARCYLQTLSLNPSAVHCWNYLRIALISAQQLDLIPAVAARDIKAMAEHYDFVLYEHGSSVNNIENSKVHREDH